MRLTEELIRAGMTGGLGVSHAQARILGIPVPLQKGWLRGLIGTEVTEDTYQAFVEAKKTAVPPVPTGETIRDMVSRWLREQPDKPRFTLTRLQIEALLRDPEADRCVACGAPNRVDGCCSRTQCYNSD